MFGKKRDLLVIVRRLDKAEFSFIARQLVNDSRLRLVFAPVDSSYAQKNYNSGAVVAGESGREACEVTVRLSHDARHPSALHVSIGASP